MASSFGYCSAGAQCSRPTSRPSVMWVFCNTCNSHFHRACAPTEKREDLFDLDGDDGTCRDLSDDAKFEAFHCAGACLDKATAEMDSDRGNVIAAVEAVMERFPEYAGVTFGMRMFDSMLASDKYHFGGGRRRGALPVTLRELCAHLRSKEGGFRTRGHLGAAVKAMIDRMREAFSKTAKLALDFEVAGELLAACGVDDSGKEKRLDVAAGLRPEGGDGNRCSNCDNIILTLSVCNRDEGHRICGLCTGGPRRVSCPACKKERKRGRLVRLTPEEQRKRLVPKETSPPPSPAKVMRRSEEVPPPAAASPPSSSTTSSSAATPVNAQKSPPTISSTSTTLTKPPTTSPTSTTTPTKPPNNSPTSATPPKHSVSNVCRMRDIPPIAGRWEANWLHCAKQGVIQKVVPPPGFRASQYTFLEIARAGKRENRFTFDVIADHNHNFFVCSASERPASGEEAARWSMAVNVDGEQAKLVDWCNVGRRSQTFTCPQWAQEGYLDFTICMEG